MLLERGRFPLALLLSALFVAGCMGSATEAPSGEATVVGALLDASSLHPLRGGQLTLTQAGDTRAIDVPDDGAFSAALPRGTWKYEATVPCFEPLTGTFEVPTPAALALRLTPKLGELPGPPQSMKAAPGPNGGSITPYWGPPTDEGLSAVVGYLLERGPSAGKETPRVLLGNSLAYGDLGMAQDVSFSYRVRAINGCGNPGPASESATGKSSSVPPVYVQVQTVPYPTLGFENLTYPATDAAGNTRDQNWKVVRGTGNPIELYLTGTPDGTIADLGNEFLQFSRDGGDTWEQVQNPYPNTFDTGAEGAVVAGPAGEIFGAGFVWFIDNIWANRWSAAEQKWYYQPVRLHEPFPDRPWIVVIKGPFQVGDAVAPFVSVFMSNLWNEVGAWNAISYDGLSYFQPTQADVEAIVSQQQKVSLDVGRDLDRDYMQPHVRSQYVPIHHGLGVRASGQLGNACSWTAITPEATWACAVTDDGPLDLPANAAIDSNGWLYGVTAEGGTITITSSRDAGKTWSETTQALPDKHTVNVWHYAVHGATDQLVVLVHADTGEGGIDQNLVYRFTDLANGPRFKEVFEVGHADYAFGSDLFAHGQQDRFDFETIAFLPDGRIAVPFADNDHRQTNNGTSLAIEQ